MRFVTPTIFFATSAFLAFYNHRGADDILAFSFIPAIWPAAAGDPQRLSMATIVPLVLMGVVFLVRDTIGFIRARRQSQEPGS